MGGQAAQRLAGSVEMSVLVHFTDLLQAYVDAAYAELCIKNHGRGRCKVREDENGEGFYWVRVHGLCVDSSKFVVKLRRICPTWFVKRIELNGSKRYVKVVPS